MHIEGPIKYRCILIQKLAAGIVMLDFIDTWQYFRVSKQLRTYIHLLINQLTNVAV